MPNDAAISMMQEDIRDLQTEIIKLELAVKLLIERQQRMLELIERMVGQPLETVTP